MEIRTGFPFRGKALDEIRDFLDQNGLKYDEGIHFSLCFVEDKRIIASGSLDGNVLKCIAVSGDYQEMGLTAQIVSGLVNEAARSGIFHLFLFTKPENESIFGSLGFYTIAATSESLLMENKKNGIKHFVNSLYTIPVNKTQGLTGAIVMNCNPFTKGHQYLIETAAQQCALLHIFVVSEDRSAFPPDVRYRLVKDGISFLSHVRVHQTGPYLVSAASFPEYFLKDSISPQAINAQLDLTIFAEHFAPALGIQCRFVGTEPSDPVTAAYNRQMQEFLPRHGIKVREIERILIHGTPVSASRVRQLIAESRLEEVRDLVPASTYQYLCSIGKKS